MAQQPLKGRFDFRLGAPSFIYPADYIANVQLLAGHLDEIELLVFESSPHSLPTPKTIAELVRLGRDLNIGYNVHLPLDLKLESDSPVTYQKSFDRLLFAMERVAPLNASTNTLHLNYAACDHRPDSVLAWQSKMISRLKDLLKGAPLSSGQISIETLDYPPAYFTPIVDTLKLQVCLDIGHLVRYGHSITEAIELYGNQIDIIHLHGVIDGQDHLSAHHLSSRIQQSVIRYLTTFRGSLSVEVFDPQRLWESLTWLETTLGAPSDSP